MASQEIIRQAVLKTDPNWKEGDEGFVLGEDGIPCPYTINMSNLPDDETEKDWKDHIQVNLLGVVKLSKHFLPSMIFTK